MTETQLEFDFIKPIYHVKFCADTGADSPREHNTPPTGYFLVMSGNRYIKDEAREVFEELKDFEFSTIKEDSKKLTKLGFSSFPVSIFDHSGVSIRSGEYSGWDCGVIGFYISKNKEEFEKYAENEIKVLNAYWQGDVLQVGIFDEHGDLYDVWSDCYFIDNSEEEIYNILGLEDYNISMEEFKSEWDKRYENEGF